MLKNTRGEGVMVCCRVTLPEGREGNDVSAALFPTPRRCIQNTPTPRLAPSLIPYLDRAASPYAE